MNTTESAIEAAGYGMFARLLGASQLGGLLQGDEVYTIFAPADAAFDKFPGGSIDALMKNADLTRAVAAYHLALGKVMAKRFAGVRIRANTVGGQSLIIDGKKELRVNGANLVQPDVMIGTSVLHGIDGVLWPREPAAVAR